MFLIFSFAIINNASIDTLVGHLCVYLYPVRVELEVERNMYTVNF